MPRPLIDLSLPLEIHADDIHNGVVDTEAVKRRVVDQGREIIANNKLPLKPRQPRCVHSAATLVSSITFTNGDVFKKFCCGCTAKRLAVEPEKEVDGGDETIVEAAADTTAEL
jgi:hypothetical protein